MHIGKHGRIIAMIIVLILMLGTCTTFAAVDPAVTIVNPSGGSTLYSDSLLVSVKIAKPATVRVSVYQIVKPAAVSGGTPTAVSIETYVKNLKADSASKVTFSRATVMAPVTQTYAANLSFYTKKLEGIKPGVYIIRAETLDSSGRILYSSEIYVGVKSKSDEAADKKIFESGQSGTMQFFKTVLKGIFGG